MLSDPADLRMVTRASLAPTLRDSSFTGLSKLCPAKAVEAQAVAAAMAETHNAQRSYHEIDTPEVQAAASQ